MPLIICVSPLPYKTANDADDTILPRASSPRNVSQRRLDAAELLDYLIILMILATYSYLMSGIGG
jgi:hypothetical protein